MRVSTLAAATAQREAAVRLGLDWLVEKGHIAIVDEEAGEIQFTGGTGVEGSDLKGATKRLQSLLEETGAYRLHFSRAPAERVLSL